MKNNFKPRQIHIFRSFFFIIGFLALSFFPICIFLFISISLSCFLFSLSLLLVFSYFYSDLVFFFCCPFQCVFLFSVFFFLLISPVLLNIFSFPCEFSFFLISRFSFTVCLFFFLSFPLLPSCLVLIFFPPLKSMLSLNIYKNLQKQVIRIVFAFSVQDSCGLNVY